MIPSRFTLPVALLAALLLHPVALRAQETLSSVQRELDRVERETEREKELHKAERARAAEFEKQKAARLAALQEQIASADARIDSLKQRTEVERKRRSTQRAIAAQFQNRQKAFRANLDREIKAMVAWTEADFPYQRDRRVSEWKELAEGNREETLPVEEVLVRLFGLLQGSLDIGFDSETYPGTYTASKGGQSEGVYVRLGAILMVFSSTDNKTQAYLAKTPAGYVWRDTDLSSGIQNAITAAVRVAQGKEAPRLVPLPIEVASGSMKGGAK
jgi:TolA-binding protein